MLKIIIPIVLNVVLVENWALPTQFSSSCSNSHFYNSTHSTVLKDHKDCQKMYVMPPKSGEVKLDSFTESSNLGFCPSVRNVFKIIKKLDQSKENLLALMDKQEKEISELIRKKQDVEKALVRYEKSLFFKEKKELTRQLEDISLSIESYIEDYDECSANCDLIAEEIKDLKKDRHELKLKLRELEKENRSEFIKSERLLAEKESLENLVTELYGRLDKRQNLIRNINDQVESQYRFYAQLEGGLVNLSYHTTWDNDIELLNDQYKGQYQFSPIPSRNVRIHMAITAQKEASYLNSLPILLDYSINGVKALKFDDRDEQRQSGLSSSLTGLARLSLIGACPIKYKNFLSDGYLEENTDLKLGPFIGVSLTYDFPSNFNFNVKASYNLFKFYERIESSVGKSGLFSRKIYHSLVENRIDKDSFSIDWEIEDADHTLNWEKRQKITSALKESLIQRVLTMTASPIPRDMLKVKNYVEMPKENGADAIANGLKDYCFGTSSWCRGEVFLFKSLSSIFSRSEARSEFRSKWDRTASERWSENIANWRSAGISFSLKEEK